MAVASVAEPHHILEAQKAVFIQQRVNYLELLTGCEQRNFYGIYEADPTTLEKGTGYPLFFAQEDSTCFCRQCCGAAREFNMEFFQRHPTQEKGKGPLLGKAHRPFKFCITPCCNRPIIYMRDASDQLLGEVVNPFQCCDLKLTVRAPTAEGTVSPLLASDGKMTGDWYYITASCCQPGLCCRCPCGACKRIIFEITNVAGEKVGQVDHVWNGCCKSTLTDADNYAIRFPDDATWYQKATIMAGVVLLDFLWFERKHEHNGGDGM